MLAERSLHLLRIAACHLMVAGLSMGGKEDAGLLLHIRRSLCLISSMSRQEVPRMAAMIVNDGAGSQDCSLARLLVSLPLQELAVHMACQAG